MEEQGTDRLIRAKPYVIQNPKSKIHHCHWRSDCAAHDPEKHLPAMRSKNSNRESRESTRIRRIHEGLFNPFVLIRVIRGKNLTGRVF